MNVELIIHGLRKRFHRHDVINMLNHSARSGEVIGVIGSNGSGKSTLMKMLAGLLEPDSGSVRLVVDGVEIDNARIPQLCGLVAPYLQIYDEFTPTELIQLHAELHGVSKSSEQISAICHTVQLAHVAATTVKRFSSGMRQRVAIALAISLGPALLLLDEPGVTLDADGRTMLASCIDAARRSGSIVFVATNDERERALCDRVLNLSPNIA